MKIGCLYKVITLYWLIFPSKEIAISHGQNGPYILMYDDYAFYEAARFSSHYECDVSYLQPKTIVVFIEECADYKRIMTIDGKVGWIFFHKCYNDSFEEIKT